MKILLILSIALLSCTAAEQPVSNVSEQTQSKTEFTYRIFLNPDNTYGYDVYKDTAVLIHQDIIPTYQGSSGFKDSAKACIIAEMVVSKLKNGSFPPGMLRTEIDSIINLP